MTDCTVLQRAPGVPSGLYLGVFAVFLLTVGCSWIFSKPRCDQSFEIVSVTRAGVAYSVELEGNAAYVTNNDGVVIFDIDDPASPARIGTVATGVSFDISVRNGLAFVVGEGGFSIVDVRDPTDPRIEAAGDLEGIGWSVRVDGSTAFVGSSRGLEVVDITNLDDPRRVGFLDFGGDVMGVALREDRAFLGGFFSGLHVLDIGDPAAPEEIATLEGIRAVENLELQGETLFIASHRFGIRIVNVADPLAPRLLGTFVDDDGGEALALSARGSDVFVADNYRIEWIHISDPAQPCQVGECERVSGAHDIEYDGSLVYIAEAMKGLVILRPVGGAGD